MSIRDMKHTTVKDVLALRQAAIELEEKNAALAAHVERLTKDADHLSFFLVHDYNTLKKPSDAAFSVLQDTLVAKPTTSLARRDAGMKADALEKLYRESQGSSIVARGTLIDEARSYRQQAEAGQ